MAQQLLDPNPRVRWQDYQADYAEIRKEIGETLPAKKHAWRTKTGRANFVTPTGLDEDADMPDVGHDSLRLMTLRSNDQFNTTVYDYDDRFRGIKNTRKVVLMNRSDIDRLGLKVGQAVTLKTVADDGADRRISDRLVVAHNIPIGCIGGYHPECNVLMPLWHYAFGSMVAAAKTIPVTVHLEDERVLEPRSEHAAG